MDQESGSSSSADLEHAGDAVYAVITIVLAFFPSVAYQILPGGQLNGKTEDFLFVFIATLPLSVALTAIGLVLVREVGDPGERPWICLAILVGSAVVGWGLGTTQEDVQFFQGIHGPPLAYIAATVFYIFVTYAVLYGGALFVAAFVASGWAVYWLHNKLPSD
jgi:hypothetical protein